MNFLNIILAALSAAAGYYSLQILDAPNSHFMAVAFGSLACYALTLPASALKRKVIVRLRGLSWTREDFCRGWLITGDTGSGKTRSGITPLLYQVFKNEPGWGGVCIDDKGLYWETLSEMAAHFNRQNDLILLQVKPDNAAPGWAPQHAYNLTSDRSIPASTYAKFVVALIEGHPLEQIYRRLRTLRLAEGESDVLRINVARGRLDLDQGRI